MTTAQVAPSPAGDIVLSLAGVTKRFGAVQALSDVHMDVRAGEVVALVGDNGAGKSTLVKVISGVYSPDEGDITFAGRKVTVGGPSEAQALGIATVFQDLALCDNLDVVANLFLGQEKRLGVLLDEVDDGEGGVAAAPHAVRQDPVGAHPDRLALRWSAPDRRDRPLLVGSPKIVMLDEPTAALGVAQTAEVLNLIERLRETGLGVILISHNMADVQAVADRIVVLRLGRNAAEFNVADATTQDLVAAITGASDNVVSARAARGAVTASDLAPEEEGGHHG